MARPLIATDVPGCREAVVAGSTGLLCEPRSAASLAAAMTRMLELSSDERAGMGRAGRAMVEARFDERLVHQAYLDVIARIEASGAVKQQKRK